MKLRSLIVLGTTALALSACGGKKTAPAPQENATLGNPSKASGETAVTTEHQVTQTVRTKTKVPTVRSSTVKADINRMDANQFYVIGFPKEVAENAVKYRQENGPYKTVDDLKKVDGMNDDLFGKLQSKVGVGKSK